MDIDSLLQPFQHFGVHLGLDRILKLLANLGNPHQQVPVIHVAGTNGKGSVCAYLSSVLTEAGYRTGRYTSPHLVDWTERICVNDQAISTEELCQLLQEVSAAIRPDEESPTQFEVITAAAWLYFAKAKVDVAVIEVGLGGRLDATNVCEQPLVTIITSISREHWQQLGPKVADIAKEKAGILKAGCPAVIGPLPADAEIVRSRILELQCPFIAPQPSREIATGWAEYTRWGDGEIGRGGDGEMGRGGDGEMGRIFTTPNSSLLTPNFSLPTPNSSLLTPNSSFPTPDSSHPKSIKYPLPLQGQIQLTNSAIAIAALEILQHQGWQISESAIVNGMAKTRWAGRMQWTTWKNHQLLLDGAHNPAAAQVLRDYVDSLLETGDWELEIKDSKIPPLPDIQSKIQNPKSKINWVMGMLSTKDHGEIFSALLQPGDKLFLVPVPDHSSAVPEELAQLAKNICPELSLCSTYPDLSSALSAAFASTDNLVVLCGSLYLVGDFLRTVIKSGVMS